MFVVLADFVQRMAPDLIDELCLAGIRHWQCAATVTDGHRRKIHFFPVRDCRCSKLKRTGFGDDRLIFTVMVFSLIRVNRDDVAVIRQRAGVEIARHILNNVEADKMAAGWLCIRNEPLHLVIHVLADAGL